MLSEQGGFSDNLQVGRKKWKFEIEMRKYSENCQNSEGIFVGKKYSLLDQIKGSLFWEKDFFDTENNPSSSNNASKSNESNQRVIFSVPLVRLDLNVATECPGLMPERPCVEDADIKGADVPEALALSHFTSHWSVMVMSVDWLF